MQETIAEAVYEAMRSVDVVSQEDRELFREMYGAYLDEGLMEEHDEGDVLGYEVAGSNEDFAGLIVTGLLADGEVEQEDGRKVFKVVKGALDDYPQRMINGRMQNYFEGTPEDFAEEVAEKIQRGLEKKGLLGRVKGLLGRRV